jgi:hypothetical protein
MPQLVLGMPVPQVGTVVVVDTLVTGANIRSWNKKNLTQINQCVGTHL